MKRQGKKVPQTNQNTTLLEFMARTTEEITKKEFRKYIIKKFCELKDDIREQKMILTKSYINKYRKQNITSMGR